LAKPIPNQAEPDQVRRKGRQPERSADGEEAEVKRAMVEHAARVIVVVAGEKVGTLAPYLLTPITRITHLVTDLSASPDVVSTLREIGIEVVIA
jgi:DeoR/GlpR family transcriptional regulator of sugar metabolism